MGLFQIGDGGITVIGTRLKQNNFYDLLWGNGILKVDASEQNL